MQYEIFAELLTKKGVRTSDVAKATGINPTVFSEWKKGKSSPKSDKLQKIADFFGVSMEYLMTGQDPDPETGYYLDPEAAELAEFAHKNPEYKVLFDASRNVKPEDINFVLEMIKRASNYDD